MLNCRYFAKRDDLGKAGLSLSIYGQSKGFQLLDETRFHALLSPQEPVDGIQTVVVLAQC